MVRLVVADLILFRAPEPVCMACGRLNAEVHGCLTILLLYMVTLIVMFAGATERFSCA